MSTLLDKPIEYLRGVGPLKGDILKKELQIFTCGDMLRHYPFRYIDRSKYYTVAEVSSDQYFIQLKGTLGTITEMGHGHTKRLVSSLKDKTGSIELVWFKGAKWVQKSLVTGMQYIVFGKPNFFNGRYNLPHPEIEMINTSTTAQPKGLQPMYNSTEKMKVKGLDSRGLGKIVSSILSDLRLVDADENIPLTIIEKYGLVSRFDAMHNIHYPTNDSLLEKSINRLKYEELLMIQVRLLGLKVGRKKHFNGFVFEKIDNHFDQFYKRQLKFDLTGAQKRVLREIRKDVLSGRQMNRLLQGDVGSGKTIVALMTQLMAIDNGFQAAMMAPTEILAQQHLKTLEEYLAGMTIKVALLTGSVKGKARKLILEQLANGEIDILIGTHALIEDTVQFNNLGCVIIDEQHRFGVAQRAQMWEKNERPPHILVMTATPIPRTLAMTLYGDLDISAIDELPPGRKPIKTVHRYDSNRLAVFQFMREEIAKGRQIYVVYPIIKESEKMDLKDLHDGYESIVRAFPMPQYQVSIVHGQMKAADKDFEMQRFVKGDTQIMVATTVIEVGVNVPNASVMVIENAERFGLAQLHQLRGRVGRGADQSFCVLMTNHKLSADGRKRIDTMVRTTDGFEISEVDLEIRGPGDLTGTQQSGVLDLHLADIVKDTRVLQAARLDAEELLDNDPDLQLPTNQPLRRYLTETYRGQTQWSKIS